MPALSELAIAFLVLGATSFGGLWAAMVRIERVLVDQHSWVTRAELSQLVTLATLVPGPTFVALGGMMGYRLRGLRGAAVCIAALLLPSSVAIVVLMWVLPATWIAAGLGMVGRAVGIAVAGLLLGTALNTATRTPQPARGMPLAVVAAALMILGVPTLVVIIGGLIAGRFLLPVPDPQAPKEAP